MIKLSIAPATVKIAALVSLTPCLSTAEPSPIVARLIDDQPTMLDWGLVRLEDYMRPRVEAAVSRLSGAADDYNYDFSVFYVQPEDKIVVQLAGSNGSSSPEAVCRDVTRELVWALGDPTNYEIWFSHAAEPDESKAIDYRLIANQTQIN